MRFSWYTDCGNSFHTHHEQALKSLVSQEPEPPPSAVRVPLQVDDWTVIAVLVMGLSSLMGARPQLVTFLGVMRIRKMESPSPSSTSWIASASVDEPEALAGDDGEGFGVVGHSSTVARRYAPGPGRWGRPCRGSPPSSPALVEYPLSDPGG